MPTITKEAERALMEVGANRVARIEKLERERRAVYRIALSALEASTQEGTVRWRNALEKITALTA